MERNVGNVYSLERPPPTADPGMQAPGQQEEAGGAGEVFARGWERRGVWGPWSDMAGRSREVTC